MRNSTNLIKKKCYFSWRKRGSWGVLQVAVGTQDPAVARRAALAAALTFEEIAPMLETGQMSVSEARTEIAAAIRLEVARATIAASVAAGRARFDEMLRRAVGAHVTAPAPAAEPIPQAEDDTGGRDPSIVAVAARLCKDLADSGRANDKTRAQIAKTAALFAEATGIDDVRRVRQGHLADFVDVLRSLPPTYRKSPAERDMTLAEIIEAAAVRGAKVGLAPATINRTLTQLHQIFDAADAEGISVNDKLRVSRLKRVDPIDEKDKRHPFSDADVAAIFASPVFRGSKSVHRRWTPGPEIIRDALYWMPLIAAYTGARREEIAGMMREEIGEVGGYPVWHIRPNDERGLKSSAGERVIPLHPHLIELGLLDHAAEGRMFPDLGRKHAGASLGDDLDYRWRQLQMRAGVTDEKKTFHSFRHRFIDLIERHGGDLSERTRNELSGHAQAGTRNRVYGGDADIGDKVIFIYRIPRVF